MEMTAYQVRFTSEPTSSATIFAGLMTAAGVAAANVAEALQPQPSPGHRVKYEIFSTPSRQPLSYELSKDESLLSNLIARIHGDARIPLRHVISQRLYLLLDEYKEYHDDSVFSLSSLSAFHGLLVQVPNLRLPVITITEAGEVFTRWKRSSEEVLSLRFFSEKDISYVVFQRRGDSIARTANRTSLAALPTDTTIQSLDWVVS